MANFPFETTRTAIQLVLNGVVDRYPGLRIILSHAGGFLPYGSLRFAELARVFNPAAPSPDAILASFRRFYFDTALSSGAALPTLTAFASPGYILFGTDSPLRPRRRRRLHRRAGHLRQPDRRRPGLDQPPQRQGPVPAPCPATRSRRWPATTVTPRTELVTSGV
jgi:Amidohydrolase